ncbi:helix-turn-helix domain-containing protein [Enterococcus faecium]
MTPIELKSYRKKLSAIHNISGDKKPLSQARFAQLMGCSKDYIRKMEQGKEKSQKILNNESRNAFDCI